MTTSLDALVQLLPLSTCVALTGLLTPIALSFILTPAFGFPLVHSFAAGSALSSTSLGTILTVLQPRVIGFDLRQTKLGVVLLSAAVMDDVVAFILAKILAIVGSGSGSGTGSNELGQGIGRAIGVTIGLAVVSIPIAKWALKPLWLALLARRARWEKKTWGGQGLIFVLMALLWIGLIAASAYGGTSPLYGVYLAGLITSYLQRTVDSATRPPPCQKLDSIESVHPVARAQSYPTYVTAPARSLRTDSLLRAAPKDQWPNEHHPDCKQLSFVATFETYLYPVMTYLLLPLFFGSIGYSIPFVALWTGRSIWRGIVYAVLMIFAKAIAGIWLLIWPVVKPAGQGRGWRAALFLGLAMVARGEIGLL